MERRRPFSSSGSLALSLSLSRRRRSGGPSVRLPSPWQQKRPPAISSCRCRGNRCAGAGLPLPPSSSSSSGGEPPSTPAESLGCFALLSLPRSGCSRGSLAKEPLPPRPPTERGPGRELRKPPAARRSPGAVRLNGGRESGGRFREGGGGRRFPSLPRETKGPEEEEEGDWRHLLGKHAFQILFPTLTSNLKGTGDIVTDRPTAPPPVFACLPAPLLLSLLPLLLLLLLLFRTLFYFTPGASLAGGRGRAAQLVGGRPRWGGSGGGAERRQGLPCQSRPGSPLLAAGRAGPAPSPPLPSPPSSSLLPPAIKRGA
uniref:Uncharacterized protein n=1 Tax=Pogona vitticeps TaxID=103695 RepID=A0ABM5EY68_9SAUR